MKTRTWIILLLALLGIFVGAALLLRGHTPGTVAVIRRDGRELRRIDLSAVTEPYTFLLTDGEGHENTVSVEPGRIRVSAASCPDQVCVHFGWLESGAAPIVCLPARLSIALEGGPGGPDAVTG